jgi:hypothetical protein
VRRARFGTLPRMPTSVRAATVLVAAGLALASGACRITPDEIARIETENVLLREQIRSMRLECEQYRRIDIGVEEPAAPPARDERPEAPPAAADPAP